MTVCANIFGANVLKPRFKIDAVMMIICGIVVCGIAWPSAVRASNLKSKVFNVQRTTHVLRTGALKIPDGLFPLSYFLLFGVE